MKEMVIILFSAILVNNFVLVRFLGICPFLGVEIRLSRDSFAVIFVMVLATIVTFPITWDC